MALMTVKIKLRGISKAYGQSIINIWTYDIMITRCLGLDIRKPKDLVR